MNEIEITLREGPSLHLSKRVLTENSSVFTNLLEDLGLLTLQIEDFTPEIVIKFLKALQDKKLDEIADSHFRELHKLSVVFQISWLIAQCREWLVKKIDETKDTPSYHSLLFLFNECYYIFSKWKINSFMVKFILKRRFKDNTTFISNFVKDNKELLKTDHLGFLLHLSGGNTRIILQIILERFISWDTLDNNSRFLLQHVNWPLCEQLEEVNEIFDRLSEMRELSHEDQMFVLKLTETTRRASLALRQRGSVKKENVIWDSTEWLALNTECTSLTSIICLITTGKIKNMYAVIDMISKVALEVHLSLTEITAFLESLENLCQSVPLQRVSPEYINMFLSALEFSEEENKDQFMKLLNMIVKNNKLCSHYDNLHLVGEERLQSPMVKSLKDTLGIETPCLYDFKMAHPGVTNCNARSQCGFTLHRFGRSKIVLSTEHDSSEVHKHDVVRADHMYWYPVWSGEGGWRVPLKNWSWLKSVATCEVLEEVCVDYDVRDYLVARC